MPGALYGFCRPVTIPFPPLPSLLCIEVSISAFLSFYVRYLGVDNLSVQFLCFHINRNDDPGSALEKFYLHPDLNQII